MFDVTLCFMFAYLNSVMEMKLRVLNVGWWLCICTFVFDKLILASFWCSCWCVFVEEQEDICICTRWSNCSICFFWAARVPSDYLGVPHFYFGPCSHVLMVQCVHLCQQVSVVMYISISYDYACLVYWRTSLKQVSSSHPWSSTSRRSVSTDCCWFEDWNQSCPCYAA